MFESIEIRKVRNGIIVTVNTDDSQDDYVFDTSRKAMKFVKDFVETDKKVTTPADA